MGAKGSANHQEMLLRMYWDGSERPAVEAPLGDFFANCFGKRSEVVSIPVTVADGTRLQLFWRMPFRKSARIEIVNQSDKPISLLYYNIDWIKKDRIADDTPYFYAQYRQEYPVKKGQDYVFLETKGKGHYVGTVLAVRTRSPAWFGEGDEKIYIDGESEGLDLGHGHGRLLPLRLGPEAHQHALFRRALFRSMGHRGRTHLGLSLAHQRPDRLQYGHQGEHRALRLAAARRESQIPGDELERARRRLRQRGLLVSDGRIDLYRPCPACPRAPPAQPGAAHGAGGRFSPMPQYHGAGDDDRPATRSLRGKQLLYMPEQGRRRVDRDTFHRREERAAAIAAERDEELRFRQVPHFARTA